MSGRTRDLLWLLITLLLAAAAITYAHLPLIFDGSLVLLKMREYTGFCIPHHRFGDEIIQFPALALMRLTDDLVPAITVFSASYAVIPLIVIFLSWVVVRNRQPSLLVWPVIAVCLTALCAQLMQVGEAHIADQLAWPLFLGVLTRPGRLKCGLLLILAVLIATFHPLSVLWLLFTAAAALVVGYKFPSSRANLSWLGTLLVLIAVARQLLLFAFLTEYEMQNLSAGTAAALARKAFSDWGLTAAVASVTAGALLLPVSIFR